MGEITFKNGNNVPSPTNQPKKHYWWRYLLVWIASFFFTLGLVAGGVAIAGGAVPSKSYFKMIGFDPNEYLTEEYQNKSIFGIIKSVMGEDIDTLEDVNRITPLVHTYFDQINEDFLKKNLDFVLDWDEAKVVPFKKKDSYAEKDYELNTDTTLPEYVVDELTTGVKIANFINIDGSPYQKVLTYFLYDIERDPTTGEILKDENGNPIIGQAYSLKDFMNKKDKPSSEAIEVPVDDVADNDFFKHVMDNVLDCATITDLSPNINPDDPLINAIKGFTLREIMNGELNDKLTVGKVLGKENETGILAKLFSMTLRQVNELDFDKAQFSDLLSITYPYYYDKELGKYFVLDIDVSAYDGDLYICENEDAPESERVYTLVEKDKYAATFSPLLLRTMGTFHINDIQDEGFIDGIKLCQLIPINKDSEKALNTLGNYTFGEIKTKGFIDGLTLDSLINIPEKGQSGYSPVLAAIGGYTLEQLRDDSTFKSIRISDLYDKNNLDPEKDKILIALIDEDTDENPINLGNIASRINEIQIGKLMDLDEDASRLTRTVSQKTLSELPDLINKLTVADVMDLDPGSSYKDEDTNEYYFKSSSGEWTLYATEEAFHADYDEVDKLEGYYEGYKPEWRADRMLSGKGAPSPSSGINRSEIYDIKDVQISNPGNFINEIKQKMKLEALVDINENSPVVLQNLKYCTLDKIPEELQKFTLNQLIDIPSDNMLLSALSEATLFNSDPDNQPEGMKYETYIGNKINNLQLGQIIMIDTSSPVILQTLSTYTLGGANPITSIALDSLPFNQIVTKEQFVSNDTTGLLNELWDSDDSDGNFTIGQIPSKLMSCKLITVIGSQIFDVPKYTDNTIDDDAVISPQWWLLLQTDAEYKELSPEQKANRYYGDLGKGKAYTFNEVTKLMDNMKAHMLNRTLRELSNAKFIDIDNATLDKSITGLGTLGEKTLMQIITFISAL